MPHFRLPLSALPGRLGRALRAATAPGSLCALLIAGTPLAASATVRPRVAAPATSTRSDDLRRATTTVTSVRVRLLRLARPRTLTLVADGAAALRAAPESTPMARLRAGTSVALSIDGGQVTVRGGGETWRAPVLYLDADAFTLELPSGGRDARRRYSGTLRLDDDPSAPGTLRLVHTVDMERYVAAVVQREYGLGDLEGAKAMAVAARTYALRSRGRFGREYDLVDDIQSQVFFGLQGVSDRSRAAAEQTRGEVLTYRGQLAEAVYSSSSGGHTAANETIWGTAPVPYLRARPDPYDTAVSPFARWSKPVPRAELLGTLSARLNVPVNGFTLVGVGICGRSTTVEALLENGRRQRLTTARFRSLVNGAFGGNTLRSARFTVRPEGDTYVFEGGGFGHGVGMSQWGAHGQALAGRSYRDILAFYYEGTTLRGVDGVAVPLAPLPSAVRPEAEEAAMLDRAFAHLGTATPSASGATASGATASTRPDPARPEPTRTADTPRPPARTDATRRDPVATDPAPEPRRTEPTRPTEPLVRTNTSRPRSETPREVPAQPRATPAHPDPARADVPPPGGWTGAPATRPPARRTGW